MRRIPFSAFKSYFPAGQYFRGELLDEKKLLAKTLDDVFPKSRDEKVRLLNEAIDGYEIDVRKADENRVRGLISAKGEAELTWALYYILHCKHPKNEKLAEVDRLLLGGKTFFEKHKRYVIDNNFPETEHVAPSLQRLYAKLAVVGTALLGVSGILIFSFSDSKTETLPSLEKQLILQGAWDNLLRKVPGDTGKGRSLSTIVNQGFEFKDANLSCAFFNDASGKRCPYPAIFSEVRIGDKRFTDSICTNKYKIIGGKIRVLCGYGEKFFDNAITIRNVSFSGNKFERWDVHSAFIDNSKFSDVKAEGYYFAHSEFYNVNFDGFECFNCGFSEMKAPESLLKTLRGGTFVGGLVVMLSETPPSVSSQLTFHYSNPPLLLRKEKLDALDLNKLNLKNVKLSELKNKLGNSIVSKLDDIIYWKYYDDMEVCLPDEHPEIDRYIQAGSDSGVDSFSISANVNYPGEPYYWPLSYKGGDSSITCLSPSKSLRIEFENFVYAAVLNISGY